MRFAVRVLLFIAASNASNGRLYRQRSFFASGSTIKFIAIKPSGEGGAVFVGRLSRPKSDSIVFTSGGSQWLISLTGAAFRKVALTDVIQLSSSESWDEGLELHWLESGNFVVLLRLGSKISVPEDLHGRTKA